jgi:hypothetical protein
MKLFMNDDELEEIKPVSESADKGIVISDRTGKREEGISELQKEIVALDAILIGPSKAAEIHGVPQSSASKYSDGKDITNEDTKGRVLATRYDIQDVATAKLMATLNLINPEELVSTKNKVMVLNSLSRLVDTVSDKNPGAGNGGVHLHLYAPNQKKESDYEIIES